MSSEREALKSAFLAAHGLGGARREALTGDASTRNYERLHRPGAPSLIFMDQPPALETTPCPPDATAAERAALGYNASARLAAGRIDAFIATAGYLRGLGLSAPEVVAADPASGLAVLEDLGDDLYARLIAGGAPEAPFYEAAIDLLIRLHQAPPPKVLEADGARWPLLTYDALALKTGGDMFIEWWPKYSGAPAFSEGAIQDWNALWDPIRQRGETGANVFTHRDYHAENLVWLPDRGGVARVGLLDFQDALVAHPAWDLLSLLQDARRDVDPALETAMLDRYLAARPDLDRAQFLEDYRGLAALNAARILFIFARQVAGFDRPRYRALLPRVWGTLERNLQASEFTGLRAWFDREIPKEQRR
ncbi:MAG: phosphotransferase [Caulobacteraceae bacterium]|nr:phosphotransferase [Caulobacteraceae bacterium]